jgi:nuclear pore complex protein Nup210
VLAYHDLSDEQRLSDLSRAFFGGKKNLKKKDQRSTCSNAAMVRAEALYAERRSTWILAEDELSGRVLRCEVYVDVVQRIEITSTTRTLYKEDVEMLSVQAFDRDGNLFSSVAGLQFDWSIGGGGGGGDDASLSSKKRSGSLTFVPFASAAIEVDDVVLAMERRGQETALVLVQGLETGRARVSTRLAQAGYASDAVAPAQIELAVLEPLQLFPLQTMYAVRGTNVPFELKTYKRDRFSAIGMPSAQYRWRCSDDAVGAVDERGVFYARAPGDADVSVRPVDMPDNEARARIFVVEPASLRLRVVELPQGDSDGKQQQEEVVVPTLGTTRYLVAGRRYALSLELYDDASHRVLNSANIRYALTLGTDGTGDDVVLVVESGDNWSSAALLASSVGAIEVRAALDHVLDARTGRSLDDGGGGAMPSLEVRERFVINERVRLEPPALLLPVGHTFALRVHGGSVASAERFLWRIDDSAVAAVSARGVVTAHGIGETPLRVSDGRNPLNAEVGIVRVLTPASLALAPERVEVQVGSPLELPLVARDCSGAPFDNCTALPLQWSLSNAGVFALQETSVFDGTPPPVADACVARTLFALSTGRTDVTVRLGAHHATVSVFAYEPLRLLAPLSGSALLSAGASIDVAFVGGPNPFHYEPTRYFRELTAGAGAAGDVRIDPLPSTATSTAAAGAAAASGDGIGGFRVTCVRHGAHNLTLRVGNRPSKRNAAPAEASAHIDYRCAEPSALLVYPADDDRDRPKCADAPRFPTPETFELGTDSDDDASPRLPSSLLFRVRNNRTVAFNVSALLRGGDGAAGVRRFDNFSTLDIEWHSSDAELASFSLAAGERQQRWQRSLAIGARPGILELGVSLRGASAGSLLAPRYRVQLLDNVRIEPVDGVTLYAHASNVATLRTLGGSGYFQVRSNDTDALSLETTAAAASGESSRASRGAIALRPLRRAATVRLSVADRCLGGSTSAHALVHIADVGSVRLSALDMVELGESVTLAVVALDDRGVPFERDADYRHMRFDVHVDGGDVVRVEPRGDASFRVDGLAVGGARITVSARTLDNATVASDPLHMHVYAPFRLVPDEVTLLVGARFQLQHRGGPPARATVTFERGGDGDDAVLGVDATLGALVARSAGEATVSAAVRVRSAGIEEIELGRDAATVRVARLRALRVLAPTSRLLVGGEMTVRVVGLADDETPFSFGGTDIQFRWTSANGEVAEASAVFELAPPTAQAASGENVPRDFAVRVVAKGAGRARLSASILSAPARLRLGSLSAYTSAVELSVVEPLRVASGAHVLLTPGASLAIEAANREPHELVYAVMTADGGAAVARCSASGVVTALSVAGQAFVAVSDPRDESPPLVVHVHVKNVHMMQLLPSAPHALMPVGSEMRVDVALRDDVGRRFDAYAGVRFEALLNSLSAVSASVVQLNASLQSGHFEEASLQLKALDAGDAIVRVADADGALDDYLRVRVGNAIEPSEPLVHVGGELLFSTPFDGAKPRDVDVWRSDKAPVLSVHPRSGKAVSRGAGSATVYHNSSSVFTYTRVRVVALRSIVVDPANETTLVSNVVVASPSSPSSSTSAAANDGGDATTLPRFDIAVRYYAADADGQLVELADRLPSVRHNIVAKCSVRERKWATASAQRDPASGAHYCRVEPFPPSASMLASRQPPSHLTVQLSATDMYESTSASAERRVAFRSAFVVRSSDIDMDRIKLSQTRQSALLEIYASADTLRSLVASSSAPERVSLERQTIADEGASAAALFRVAVLSLFEAAFDDVLLSLIDVSTGQREQFLVSYASSSALVNAQEDEQEQQEKREAATGVVEAPPSTPASVMQRVASLERSPTTMLYVAGTMLLATCVGVAYAFFARRYLRQSHATGGDQAPRTPQRRPTTPQYGRSTFSPFSPLAGHQQAPPFSPDFRDDLSESVTFDAANNSHWLNG